MSNTFRYFKNKTYNCVKYSLPTPNALDPPMLCEALTLVDVYSPVTSKPSKKVLVEIVTETQGKKETSINTVRNNEIHFRSVRHCQNSLSSLLTNYFYTIPT